MSEQAWLPRLAVTSGEPAGIGAELIVKLAASDLAADIIAIADRGLLQRAAARCQLPLVISDDDGERLSSRKGG
ncbi:MAG: 4-hydroxythreonine-4-phosphate dehydrogenase PdxA, partial [Xanthomonadales bacterium]|nr:4-hydroxythreonine-4-phosphate dehydrogenase PdxA [Xanthomonadales bacterium]